MLGQSPRSKDANKGAAEDSDEGDESDSYMAHERKMRMESPWTEDLSER